ncbi:MAG: hypothetical protein IAE84_03345 [Saprospiraceae bacterium]|nr:hypothetical protein [Saprospiraceae bacterium]
MTKKQYLSPEYDYSFSKEEIRDADKETQKSIMKTWFLWHYENPSENTPHVSSEGGFLYFCGGPYDATEELMSEFEESVSEEVIQELINELEEEAYEWAGKSNDYHYSVAVLSNTDFYSTFLQAIEEIRALFESPFDSWAKETLYRILYVNIITSLEVFLSDAFINTVLRDRKLIRNFVQTTPDFSKRTLNLDEIFKRIDSIEDEVKVYLLNFIWHNLQKVKPMYKETLAVNFPDNTDNIFRAVSIRHDIVHRNGKKKDGSHVNISSEDIKQLLADVSRFAEFLAFQLMGENLSPLNEFHEWQDKE